MDTAAGHYDEHDGLALCVIEACECAPVIERYRAYRAAQGEQAATDGVRALLRTFEETGGSDQWAGKVGNFRRRYNPAAEPVPAAAIERTAELLYLHRIETTADLRRALDTPAVRRQLESGIRDIGGDREWRLFVGLTDRDLVGAR
ncbi:hypothetical protein [Skermania piniformis]|uniref:DUF222 domain-containing protein n=1 Tax=Skermania pinensis TaxID=39122 RepID=A0ABX8S5A3_9ACTN|nr:hypothetical protein [Skermania piniformis]QXQ13012.1 hypothetical protein KV203_13985 [Skermania piniformis]